MKNGKSKTRNECCAARFRNALPVLIWTFSFTISVAEVDVSKLPPPAETKIDFVRDIQPIFEKSCLRCHGAEKPKSHFSLVSRELALRGGENGIDIIPGDSARSPLIHNVARLVEDMEMPPPGKGEPLTKDQISLLRAWIDQGAQWATSAPLPALAFSVSPTVRWIEVEGNKSKFRELEGMREGWAGGIENFTLQEQLGDGRSFSAEGRAIPRDYDYSLKLALDKTDFGFVHGGVETWRRYYDDTGGFYRPFPQPSFDLNRDLHLNLGRAWIDFGLTLPHWPQMVLGYEYQFKEGAKSMLEWGDVDGKKIFPASKDIDEHTHIAKFDLTHEFYGWRLEDNARVEIYDSKIRSDNANTNSFTLGPGPDSFVHTREGFRHIQGQNTVRLEKQFTDWLLLSGGYLYSKLDGDASIKQTTADTSGFAAAGTFWSGSGIVLRRETHIASASTLLQPLETLFVSAGVQSEWSRQDAFGDIHLNDGNPLDPVTFTLRTNHLRSDLDRQKLSEEIAVRFTKIPWTVLFAEARWENESIDQFERDLGDNADAFLRDTDFTNDRRTYRGGFNTSPWRWISLNAHYKRYDSDSRYDHDIDCIPDELGDCVALNPGYSAFIRRRQLDGDEAATKLVLRPANWLKTTLTYKWLATDYTTATDPLGAILSGHRILAGNYDAHVYGVSAIVTPMRRLYLSAALTYSDSRTVTAHHGNPSVAPYRGDIYAVSSSANFALNKTTDLHATYSFAKASYEQNNFLDGLPLGVNSIHHALTAGVAKRLTANLVARLRYGFYEYSEPHTRGENNYTAHGVFATMTVKWP